MVTNDSSNWRGPFRGDFLQVAPLSRVGKSTTSFVITPAHFTVTHQTIAVVRKRLAHGTSAKSIGIIKARPKPLAVQAQPENEVVEQFAAAGDSLAAPIIPTPPVSLPRITTQSLSPRPPKPTGIKPQKVARSFNKATRQTTEIALPETLPAQETTAHHAKLPENLTPDVTVTESGRVLIGRTRPRNRVAPSSNTQSSNTPSPKAPESDKKADSQSSPIVAPIAVSAQSTVPTVPTVPTVHTPGATASWRPRRTELPSATSSPASDFANGHHEDPQTPQIPSEPRNQISTPVAGITPVTIREAEPSHVTARSNAKDSTQIEEPVSLQGAPQSSTPTKQTNPENFAPDTAEPPIRKVVEVFPKSASGTTPIVGQKGNLPTRFDTPAATNTPVAITPVTTPETSIASTQPATTKGANATPTQPEPTQPEPTPAATHTPVTITPVTITPVTTPDTQPIPQSQAKPVSASSMSHEPQRHTDTGLLTPNAKTDNAVQQISSPVVSRNRAQSHATAGAATTPLTSEVGLIQRRPTQPFGVDASSPKVSSKTPDVASRVESEPDSSIPVVQPVSVEPGQGLTVTDTHVTHIHPVPDDVRSAVSSIVGTSPHFVTVHRGPQVTRQAKSLNADAYTRKGEVHIPGDRPLTSSPMKKLLAHEITHVVQQNGTKQVHNENSLVGQRLENQALAAEIAHDGKISVALPGLSHSSSNPNLGQVGTHSNAPQASHPIMAVTKPRSVNALTRVPAQSLPSNSTTLSSAIVVRPNPKKTNSQPNRVQSTRTTEHSVNASKPQAPAQGPANTPTAGRPTTLPVPIPTVETKAVQRKATSAVHNPQFPTNTQSAAPAPQASQESSTTSGKTRVSKPAREPKPVDLSIDSAWLEKHAEALYPLIRKHLRNDLLRDRERRGKLMRDN